MDIQQNPSEPLQSLKLCVFPAGCQFSTTTLVKASQKLNENTFSLLKKFQSAFFCFVVVFSWSSFEKKKRNPLLVKVPLL